MRNLLRLTVRYKRLFFVFVVFFLFFAAVEINAKENELNYVDPNPQASGQARDEGRNEGKLNMEAYSQKLVDETTISLTCGIGVTKACSTDAEVREEMSRRSVLGISTQAIALAYAVPPAGVGPFIADAAMRAGFVDKAYAQGIGFASLAPLIPVWRAFRNATYAGMILVLLVFGVLIMLRRQIDPQTVITIQNSLPRIVVTLILITFSYAIAGFIIDLMYLVILLTIGLFESVGLMDIGTAADRAQKLLTGGVWEFGSAAFGLVTLSDLIGGIGGGTGGAIGGIIGIFAGGPLGATIGAVAGILAGGALSSLATGDLTVGNAIGGALSPIGHLLILIVLAFAFLRLLFMLYSSYIQIIVNIVFAPLKLAADVVPGGEGFFDWITNLIGHALVFPVTIAMLIVGNAIAEGASGGTLWSPPLIFQSGSFVQYLIGLGVILLIPNIAGSIREKFKAAAPGGITGGAVMGAAMRPVGVVSQAVQTGASLQTARQLIK